MAAMLQLAAGDARGWTSGTWPAWQYSRQGASHARDTYTGLVERAQAVGFPITNLALGQGTSQVVALWRSQWTNLCLAKQDLARLIPYFVDSSYASTGTLNGWFDQTNAFPVNWTVTNLINYLRIPLNYFDYTPQRMLSCCGDDTTDSSVGHPHGPQVNMTDCGLPDEVLITNFIPNLGTFNSPDGHYYYDPSNSYPLTPIYQWTNAPGTWVLNNDSFYFFGDWALVDLSGPTPWYGLPLKAACNWPIGTDGWYVVDGYSTAGWSEVESMLPATDYAGTNFPPGRTKWYTTDYGWCYVSNILSSLVWTAALSNDYGASTQMIGGAYGYREPNDTIPIPGGGQRDGYTFVDEAWGDHFAVATWACVTGVWATASVETDVGAWQLSVAHTLTNVVATNIAGNAPQIQFAQSNTRSNWPQIVKVTASGSGNNPAPVGLGDAPYISWLADATNPAVLLHAADYWTSLGDCVFDRELEFCGYLFTTADETFSSLARYVILRDSTQFEVNSVFVDASVFPPDCSYSYEADLTSGSLETEDAYIYKVFHGKQLRSYAPAAAAAKMHGVQFYIAGKYNAGTNAAVWDGRGYDMQPNKYRMLEMLTQTGAVATLNALYTNTAIPYYGASNTWRGYVVSNVWSVNYWGVPGGFTCY